MKNENGFILVSMLGLFPVVITIVFVFAGGAVLIRWADEKNRLCRDAAIDAQMALSTEFNKLFALNSTARNLQKISRKAARTALQMPNPITAAALAAALAAEGVIKWRQKNIMTNATRQAEEILKRAMKKSQADSFVWTSPRLVVMPQDLAIAPRYKTPPLFSKLQTIEITMTFSLKKMIPPAVLRWLKNSGADTEFSLSCRATLEKRKKRFIPTLTKDKPPSNWSLPSSFSWESFLEVLLF